MRAFEYPKGGLEANSGKIAESFAFGKVNVEDPGYEKGLEKCIALVKGSEAREKCGIELIKKFQPFDSENPKRKLLKDLLEYFKKEAGISENKNMKVKAYTAVGSVVDVEQGADLLVEVSDESGSSIYVTYDGTIRDEKIKEGKSKADILMDFNGIPDSMENPGDYENKIREYAKISAMAYRAKLPKENFLRETKNQPTTKRKSRRVVDFR